MKPEVKNVALYSVSGGALSAIGSSLGKLSGYFDSWVFAILCFVCMVGVNTVGFTLFAKSLNASSTSLRPTLLSTASNFCSTALISWIVFSKGTTPFWWVGTFLILSGIVIISRSGKEKHD